ncbi:hypothetical protein KAI87_09635, partial [Myxococcota bacterium]|nr:hypothetical protein [Myxococcota bacterium]
MRIQNQTTLSPDVQNQILAAVADAGGSQKADLVKIATNLSLDIDAVHTVVSNASTLDATPSAQTPVRWSPDASGNRLRSPQDIARGLVQQNTPTPAADAVQKAVASVISRVQASPGETMTGLEARTIMGAAFGIDSEAAQLFEGPGSFRVKFLKTALAKEGLEVPTTAQEVRATLAHGYNLVSDAAVAFQQAGIACTSPLSSLWAELYFDDGITEATGSVRIPVTASISSSASGILSTYQDPAHLLSIFDADKDGFVDAKDLDRKAEVFSVTREGSYAQSSMDRLLSTLDLQSISENPHSGQRGMAAYAYPRGLSTLLSAVKGETTLNGGVNSFLTPLQKSDPLYSALAMHPTAVAGGLAFYRNEGTAGNLGYKDEPRPSLTGAAQIVPPAYNGTTYMPERRSFSYFEYKGKLHHLTENGVSRYDETATDSGWVGVVNKPSTRVQQSVAVPDNGGFEIDGVVYSFRMVSRQEGKGIRVSAF